MTSATRIACAESIAFLYLIHPVPTQPSANTVDSPTCNSKHYTLPFHRERSLTSTLAFLSSINDDPNYIPAICVQEDSENSCLKVLIAVNQAKWGHGHKILQDIKRGFEGIFPLLALTSPSTYLKSGNWSLYGGLIVS